MRTVEEMAATRVQMAETMTGLLMSVASVSLLVGGIGIMNIMLVSVTERTREIGLRMAVGARDPRHPAPVPGRGDQRSPLVGGLRRASCSGVAVSQGLTQSLGWPTAITAASIVIAFAFAAAVGIFFGYYPARKAAEPRPDRRAALRVTY